MGCAVIGKSIQFGRLIEKANKAGSKRLLRRICLNVIIEGKWPFLFLYYESSWQAEVSFFIHFMTRERYHYCRLAKNNIWLGIRSGVAKWKRDTSQNTAMNHMQKRQGLELTLGPIEEFSHDET